MRLPWSFPDRICQRVDCAAGVAKTDDQWTDEHKTRGPEKHAGRTDEATIAQDTTGQDKKCGPKQMRHQVEKPDYEEATPEKSNPEKPSREKPTPGARPVPCHCRALGMDSYRPRPHSRQPASEDKPDSQTLHTSALRQTFMQPLRSPTDPQQSATATRKNRQCRGFCRKSSADAPPISNRSPTDRKPRGQAPANLPRTEVCRWEDHTGDRPDGTRPYRWTRP